MDTGNTIGILTSGGDAPGMNACIRAVVRVARDRGLDVVGIRHGYRGLLESDFVNLQQRDVSNIIHRGGTFLKTARSEMFESPVGRAHALSALGKRDIKGLVVIGGDGTMRGADAFDDDWPGNIVGVPGTIDNDLAGSDHTIGFDTAVNTAMEAIDKIRDTAEAHDRFFLVEVMGRNAGFIAQRAGIVSGAEEIIVPEVEFKVDEICQRLCSAVERGKTSSIIVVAEGQATGGAFHLAEELKQRAKRDYRVVVLGHLQRGGSPTAADRLLATKLGGFAVEQLIEGNTGVMVGEIAGKLSVTPFAEAVEDRKPLDPYLTAIHASLSK